MDANDKILINIIHNQRGLWRNGNICFFDYMTQQPIKGCYNIGFVRDLPHIQLEDGGFPKDKIINAFNKHKAMVNRLDAMITMTDTFAKHILSAYGINKPYRLFQNFPSWQETPLMKRNEFLYLGAKPIKFQDHEKWLNELSIKSSKIVICKYYDKLKPGVRGHISNYDYGSKYGLSTNAVNFNQAHEALNRKVMVYLMSGMYPVMHKSFIEAIKFVKSNGVNPLIYDTIEDIISQIYSHDFGIIDRKRWCIENRLPELKSMLRR